MIRWISFLLAISLSTTLYADEMSDALVLQQRKEFQQAKQIFSKLANEGNVKAQEELADMYWYGDGMPMDLAQAEYWFTKAAQAGSSKATSSLQVMKARVTRKPEITYYTTDFDGGKLKFSSSGCVKPEVPEVSKNNLEIKKVTADIQTWSSCYSAYLKALSTSPQGLALVPKDLVVIMSDADLAASTQKIDKTMAAIIAEAKSTAQEVNARIDAWKKETEAYVIKTNGGKAGMSVEEFEIFQRNIRNELEMYRNSREVMPPVRNPTTNK